MDWTMFAVIISVVVNLIIVAVGYGKLSGNVTNLLQRHIELEQKLAKEVDRIRALELLVEHTNHILPGCQIAFSKLDEGMATVTVKLDMLIEEIKEVKVDVKEVRGNNKGR